MGQLVQGESSPVALPIPERAAALHYHLAQNTDVCPLPSRGV